MIEIANTENYEQARTIWRTCFHDSDEYTRLVFSQFMEPKDVRLYTDEAGQALSMLCMKRCELVFSERRTIPAAYIFGVATLPDWRKRGLSAALLAAMEEQSIQQGIEILILVPGNSELFGFYAKRGYETAFSAKKIILSSKQLNTPSSKESLLPVESGDFQKIRDTLLKDSNPFLRWDSQWLEGIANEASTVGGGIYCLTNEKGTAVVVCYPNRQSLIVKEILSNGPDLYETLNLLHARFNATEYRIHCSSVAFPTELEPVPFAMAKWLGTPSEKPFPFSKSAYIAHVLDGPIASPPWPIGLR